MDKRPIGIFDSGVGGLTVVNKMLRLLPDERIIYFGDTARVPYGNKSKETVTRFSKEIMKFLLGFKVKIVIVACNTASSLSLTSLRKSFRVPIIGVIMPGAEEALKTSRTARIGVIGTDATISSGAYKREIKKMKKDAFVAQQSCPLFVPLAENRHFGDNITLSAAKKYLSPLLEKRIDTLILGCTHYPLLKSAIRKITGRGVKLIDSSAAVAKYAGGLLGKKGLLAGPGKKSAAFFVSDEAGNFTKLAKVFLKKRVKAKKVIF